MTAAWQRQVDQVADLLAWSTLHRSPTFGAGRLLCVDGPAGSGKTTLARALARELRREGTARVVHLDDTYQGWDGLAETPDRVHRELLTPLAEGRPGRYLRYDWQRGAAAGWRTVEPADVLVLEGVGAGAAAYHPLVTTLVWVEAPRALRVERGLARDGAGVREHWTAWMAAEEALFARERTRDRADVVVDGSGTSDRAVVFV